LPYLLRRKKRPNMKQIAIVRRRGLEVGIELFSSITCLRRAGINPRTAIIAKTCAVVWVDDEEIWISLNLLKENGFEAAYVSETGEPI
jgi:hypothetical protein